MRSYATVCMHFPRPLSHSQFTCFPCGPERRMMIPTSESSPQMNRPGSGSVWWVSPCCSSITLRECLLLIPPCSSQSPATQLVCLFVNGDVALSIKKIHRLMCESHQHIMRLSQLSLSTLSSLCGSWHKSWPPPPPLPPPPPPPAPPLKATGSF